jgi:hypothetical protein
MREGRETDLCECNGDVPITTANVDHCAFAQRFPWEGFADVGDL